MLAHSAPLQLRVAVATYIKVQRSVERAHEWTLWKGLLDTGSPYDMLTVDQRAAHQLQVDEVLNGALPRAAASYECACTLTAIVPLWPRDLSCAHLAKYAELDGLDADFKFALRRLGYVLNILPPQDGPGLVHDLIYRAIQSRLLEDGSGWPWTTAADIRVCEAEIAYRLGLPGFTAAIFAAHVLWPTMNRLHQVRLAGAEVEAPTCYRVPEILPRIICEDRVDTVLHLWEDMRAAILCDTTLHNFDPEYGCSCLVDNSASDNKSVTSDESPNTTPGALMNLADTVSLKLGATAEPRPEDTNSNVVLPSELPPLDCFNNSNVPFSQGALLFPQVLRQNRAALLPALSRLYHMAPIKELMPVIHQLLQDIMRERLLADSGDSIDWYLLKEEDVRICEERLLGILHIEGYCEASSIMAPYTNLATTPGHHIVSVWV